MSSFTTPHTSFYIYSNSYDNRLDVIIMDKIYSIVKTTELDLCSLNMTNLTTKIGKLVNLQKLYLN